MPSEGFSDKVKLLLFDKALLSLGLLGIALFVQERWHDEQLELDRGQHDSALELQRTQHDSALELQRTQQELQLDLEYEKLRIQLIPRIEDSTMDPNSRADLLSLLVDMALMEPSEVARRAQALVEQGASEIQFVRAVRPSMSRNVQPFLAVTEPIVRSVRFGGMLAEPLEVFIYRVGTSLK